MGLDLPFQKKLSHAITRESLHKSYFWGKKTWICCFSGVLYQWESCVDISLEQVLDARLFGYEILLVFLHTTSHYRFFVTRVAVSQFCTSEAADSFSWILRKNSNPSKSAKRLQIRSESSSSTPSSPRKMIRHRSLTKLHQEAELEKFLEFSSWSSFLWGLNKRQICWQSNLNSLTC